MDSGDHCIGRLKDALRRLKREQHFQLALLERLLCAAAHSPLSMKNCVRVPMRVEFFQGCLSH